MSWHAIVDMHFNDDVECKYPVFSIYIKIVGSSIFENKFQLQRLTYIQLSKMWSVVLIFHSYELTNECEELAFCCAW